MNNKIKELRQKLQNIEKEKADILTELFSLESEVNFLEPITISGCTVSDKTPVTSEEKIKLFNTLFVCRNDVYPRYWENKEKKGYSPVCINEWKKELCNKPKIKCTDCKNRNFAKLDNVAIEKHLKGIETIGTYTIKDDDTCLFLAADFDETSWKEDVSAYKTSGKEMGVDVSTEISRSGNGAHAWIFFSETVPAKIARQLGTIIMAKASNKRHCIELKSYDRFFPNQDTMPKGGFGNLIALPLQKNPRKSGNSVFVDDNFIPYSNQWEFLANIKRLNILDLSNIIKKYIGSVQAKDSDDNLDIIYAEHAIKAKEIIPAKFYGTVKIFMGSQIAFSINGMPSKLINALKLTATFANPKFFELQRLRFSTWKTPRFIFCGELLENNELLLPRGVFDSVLKIFNDAETNVEIIDNRTKSKKTKATFKGKLTNHQKIAVSKLQEHETGILVAPTGSGKSVMGCAIIAKRKVPTLILVHRAHLLEQWRDKISEFLSIDKKQIGKISGSSKKLTGKIDVAMLQSLVSNNDEIKNFLLQYEQVIIDECHHIPAFSFESVLKTIPARYFVGLTATAYRKDGHQAILYMQCGKVRHEIEDIQELPRKVIIRETNLKNPANGNIEQIPIHKIWTTLISDYDRQNMIVEDIKNVLKDGRFPIILSERREQLLNLSERIKNISENDNAKEFLFMGDISSKTRNNMLKEISELLAEGKIRPYIVEPEKVLLFSQIL